MCEFCGVNDRVQCYHAEWCPNNPDNQGRPIVWSSDRGRFRAYACGEGSWCYEGEQVVYDNWDEYCDRLCPKTMTPREPELYDNWADLGIERLRKMSRAKNHPRRSLRVA